MTVLEGRTILVTGGLGVLGAAVASAAEMAGAVIARVDFAAAADASELTSGGVDLSDFASAQAAMDAIAARRGGAVS